MKKVIISLVVILVLTIIVVLVMTREVTAPEKTLFSQLPSTQQ